MEGNYLKRLDLQKKRAEFFGPYNYGTLLTNLFDKVGVGLPIVAMIFDMQTLLIHKITDNCKAVWGYEKQEMEWMDISKLIHPDDLAKSISLADESIATKGMTITKYKNRHIDKNGEIIHMEWTVTETFNYQALCFIEKISREEFEAK